MVAGYSITPLYKKLGIKENQRILLFNQPKYYFKLFDELPEGIKILKKVDSDEVDFIHLFCRTQQELEHAISVYTTALRRDGCLWLSWPKGTSKIKTDLKREIIREYILSKTGLVDIKVAAIDADWSGLKFVYRLKNR